MSPRKGHLGLNYRHPVLLIPRSMPYNIYAPFLFTVVFVSHLIDRVSVISVIHLLRERTQNRENFFKKTFNLIWCETAALKLQAISEIGSGDTRKRSKMDKGWRKCKKY